MKRTNVSAPKEKTVTLCLELTPFELAAIHLVCSSIGGSGKTRNVFSDGVPSLYGIVQELAAENGIDLRVEQKKMRIDKPGSPAGAIYLRDVE